MNRAELIDTLPRHTEGWSSHLFYAPDKDRGLLARYSGPLGVVTVHAHHGTTKIAARNHDGSLVTALTVMDVDAPMMVKSLLKPETWVAA